MMLYRSLFLAGAAFSAFAAFPAGAGPIVVTDILPIQSLAARVTAGVSVPTNVIPPGVSPHHYSMRPSQAAKLARANVVFWIGEDYSPAFTKAVSSIANKALSVPLMEAPGVKLREYDAKCREEGDHDDEEKHGAKDRDDDHGHGHDEKEEKHAMKDDDHEGEDGHDHHGDHDPHIWLDPVNAKAIVAAMASRLAKADPGNAAQYAANAAAAAVELDELMDRTKAMLEPVHERPYVTSHEAFSYFECRFDLNTKGSIALGDASSPGPRRLASIRRTIREHGVACVFIEPQLDPRMARTAAEGSNARVGVIDPIGNNLEPGPDAYPTLIGNLARSIANCLAGTS